MALSRWTTKYGRILYSLVVGLIGITLRGRLTGIEERVSDIDKSDCAVTPPFLKGAIC